MCMKTTFYNYVLNMMQSRALLGPRKNRFDMLVIIFIFLQTTECIKSLKLLELRVPSLVPLGARAQLSCRWQLGPTDVLYSVKWYKDGKEFFRHIPKDQESLRKFALPGVDVDESDIYGTNLTLTSVSMATSGRYRCEVSGERPLFPTVSEHADLEVIDHEPIISGFRSRYSIGDKIQANCSSGRSKPATELLWYINSEPASANAVHLAHSHKHKHGLEVTSLVLDVKVEEKHFRRDRLTVKCLATLTPFYWKSNEKSAVRGRSNSIKDIDTSITANINMKTHRDQPSSGCEHNNSRVSRELREMKTAMTVLFLVYLLF